MTKSITEKVKNASLTEKFAVDLADKYYATRNFDKSTQKPEQLFWDQLDYDNKFQFVIDNTLIIIASTREEAEDYLEDYWGGTEVELDEVFLFSVDDKNISVTEWLRLCWLLSECGLIDQFLGVFEFFLVSEIPNRDVRWPNAKMPDHT